MRGQRIGKKQIIADLILVLVLLSVALSVFLIIDSSRAAGEWVEVYVDGGRVAKFALSEDGEHSLNGGTNTLIISGGAAYVVHSDCPDKTCERTGRIFRVGERIICLPNRLEVRVVGNSGDEILGV
jgi:hypothetical protein